MKSKLVPGFPRVNVWGAIKIREEDITPSQTHSAPPTILPSYPVMPKIHPWLSLAMNQLVSTASSPADNISSTALEVTASLASFAASAVDEIGASVKSLADVEPILTSTSALAITKAVDIRPSSLVISQTRIAASPSLNSVLQRRSVKQSDTLQSSAVYLAGKSVKPLPLPAPLSTLTLTASAKVALSTVSANSKR
jgi:hypothetical protein